MRLSIMCRDAGYIIERSLRVFLKEWERPIIIAIKCMWLFPRRAFASVRFASFLLYLLPNLDNSLDDAGKPVLPVLLGRLAYALQEPRAI